MAEYYYSSKDILDKAIGTDAYFQIKSILTSTKAADVAPVLHGEWILGNVDPGYFTPGGNRPWICSKCKQVVSWSLARPEYNYCNNCGAKMDLEEPHAD